MSIQWTGKIQIRKEGKATVEGFTILTDVVTDGEYFYEEIQSVGRAEQIVDAWNVRFGK